MLSIKQGRPQPYLTLKGVIKYMASAEAPAREKVLLDYKFPEGSGPSDYYSWAHDAIRAFHKAGNDIGVLRQTLLDMEARMQGANRQAVAKLDNNRRVIDCYQESFRDRHLAPQEHNPQLVDCEGVKLNLRPDLVAKEKGALRVIQFLPYEKPTTEHQAGKQEKQIYYAKQLLLFYARSVGLEVRNCDCQVFVMATGEVHKAEGPAKNFEAKLKSTMREVRRAWPELTSDE